MTTYQLPMRIPILVILLASVTGCVTPNQRLYDAEVDRLCAKDGGMRVFEQHPLPSSNFDENGYLKLPANSTWQAVVGPAFKYVYEKELIKGSQAQSARVWRYSQKLFHAGSERLVGEAVLYVRAGGDLLGGFTESNYRCGAKADLLQNVFFKGD